MSDELEQQNLIRLGLARMAIPTWRNNSGVLRDITGRPVRYGLANDSKSTNQVIKSGDLIGIGPGGRFLSIEVKPTGWSYTGRGREVAQNNWRELVQSRGGLALFATCFDEVKEWLQSEAMVR